MTLFRSISAFALLVAFAGSVPSAPGLKGKAKKHHHEVAHGVVVQVKHKDAHHGTITIARHHHHHKGTKALSGTKAAAGRKQGAGQQQAAAKKPAAGQPKAGAQAANAANPMPAAHHHHHKTYHVDAKTKFEHELKTPSGTLHARATFAEVRVGEHVAIHAHGHVAKKVEIKHHRKKIRMGTGRPGTRKKIK
jgi:hypothetical protein